MPRPRILVVVALSLMLDACTYTLVLADRSKRKIKYFEETPTFFLFGLIGHGQVDIHKICGSDDIYKLTDYQSHGQFLASFVTLGLVQQRTIGVTCGASTLRTAGDKAELDII